MFVSVLSLILNVNLTFAKPADKGFKLPSNAIEVTPNVFSLGEAYDMKSHKLVQGYAIVHKKNGQARGGNAKPKGSTTCYAVMANGAKWKNVEDWEVFPGAGLDGNFLLDRLTHSINTWETAAVNQNILGSGSLGIGPVVDPYTLDNENQVSFGTLESGTIAVTVVWGIFGGPTSNRKLVAWDQIYNTNFQWTEDALIETGKMDFWNIAIHELGHSMGLKDIYNSFCSDVTMYGYGTEGETKKRDLAPADITGINILY